MESQSEKLAKAKSLISQGGTLKEASNETGLSIDILKKHSTKENWIEEQKMFYQKMFKELQKRNLKKFIQNRQEAIENLYYIQDEAMEQLKNDSLAVDKALKVVLDVENGVSELLGILTPLEIAKLEIEIEKLENLKENDNEELDGDILQIEVID